ncbi:Hydrogenase 2 maturation protease [Pontiella desulfatans]|uniref:Hydrogenase 2 maturation protease n=1 Tax=Pontiella desulfatans TaxID=2750659 RepID=A0A6C2UBG0_PONDE|nr:hydrogenase maturation protease [Pontiella desulfatans]VGO17279.1 Hydrogenase 2 maturation protease [Pontiella desulfatans]
MIAEQRKRIAVVGMGNLLMSDDGVGVHVLHELQKRGLKGVELIDAGTAVIHTADCLRGADHIVVVDAFKAGRKPGTVYLISGDDIFENDYTLSVHSLGLKTALRFLEPGEDMMDWTLVGVEPATLEHGMELSDAVREAVEGAVRTVENLIEEWQA